MKVDFGMRCTRCNHKISDRVLGGENGSRIEKSGVCQKCHNEYNGTIVLALMPGNITLMLHHIDIFETYGKGKEGMLYSILKVKGE